MAVGLQHDLGLPWLGWLRGVVTRLLSKSIYRFLTWRYQLRHVIGGHLLTGPAYAFPNGQGNVEKFFNGRENSTEWMGKYGSIYRIWSGMLPEIVITQAEDVREFFKDSHLHTKAVDNNSGYLMNQLLGKCVGLISGHSWKTLRAHVEPPFHRSASAEYVGLIESRVEKHLKDLEMNGNIGAGILDPVADFKLLPFIIVAEIIYGQLGANSLQRLAALVPDREGLFKVVIEGGLSRFWWSQYLPTATNRKLARFQKEWRQLNVDLYREALLMDHAPPIVSMFGAVNDRKITLEELLQTIDEILFANLDVTIGGLSWNPIFLAANPQAQDLLRQEAKIHEQQQQTDIKSYVSYLQSNSSFLSACIYESSRLRPLAAFSVPQSAPTDRILQGFLIPAHTNCIVDAYALNVRNEFWGEDPAAYRPERFLEKQGTELRYNYWRFGFGPRQCMGKYVSELVIRSILLHLVSNYRLSLKERDTNCQRIEDVWISHPAIQLACTRLKSEA